MVPCPLCTNETTYYEQYGQWYCFTCNAYQTQIEEALKAQQHADKAKKQQPTEAAQATDIIGKCKQCGHDLKGGWFICPGCQTMVEDESHVPKQVAMPQAAQPPVKDYYHWMITGIKNIGNKNYPHALKAFNKVLALDKGNHSAWYLKSVAYDLMGDTDKARLCIGKVIILNKGLNIYLKKYAAHLQKKKAAQAPHTPPPPHPEPAPAPEVPPQAPKPAPSSTRVKGIQLNTTYNKYLPETLLKDVPSSIKDSIPNYMLIHKLGTGGFATVYLAKDPYGRKVALKVPRFLDETMDSSVLDKFKAEANLWRRLEHKNIVEFYTGDTMPVPHIAMELMEGGSLQGLMKKHGLSVGEATNIMLQLLDAFSYAHRMATVHRDIKPENILFTKDGVPKISDWGIGKFMASTSVSKTAGIKGTFQYSAPEQFDKKKYGKVDWSTDIFQIGIVFYEMLTGINPFFDEDLVGSMGRVINEEPEPPSNFNPDIPQVLDNLILKALQKQKQNRWTGAEVMSHELKKLVEN